MRNKCVQMSLEDIYNGVSESMESKKSELVSLLEEHINLDELIPYSFHAAFYRRMGRNHIYHLDSFLWFVILKKLFGLSQNMQLINILRCSRELRDLCGFEKVPDASQITRFYQNYCEHIAAMFEHLVDITEPICHEIHAKKADYLIYDTTGIEANVSENNPKFFHTKLKEAKKLAKRNEHYNPYMGVYALLPSESKTNPEIRQQYVNGHFCYAAKAAIVTNGLGIVRHISMFDYTFRKKHPEIVTKRTDNPDTDKEIGDSVALRPVLSDFFAAHKSFHFSTFIADSACDSYDNYSMLKNEFGFSRAVIPMNTRNSKSSNACFDASGTPICPQSGEKFQFLGKSGGRNRSPRFKWICPQSIRIPKTGSRVCTCNTPCTDSTYGKCVYTYPDKDFRLYPGVPRDTEHWNHLYKHRVVVERTINLLKDTFALADNKSYSVTTLKADLFLSGIVQLIGVILADKLNQPRLFGSIRKLLA